MLTLTRAEEDKVGKELKANARRACDETLSAFAKCATGRTVSVVWACRKEHRIMNDCLEAYGRTGAHDKLRLEHLEKKRLRMVEAQRLKNEAAQ